MYVIVMKKMCVYKINLYVYTYILIIYNYGNQTALPRTNKS